MGVELDITKVPNNKAIAITMIAVSSIFGPYWFLFQFIKPIFYKHDTITLLLLCASCGLPLFIYNATLLYTLLGSDAKEDKWPRIGILSSLLSMAPWYLPCAFTIDHSFSSKEATKIAFFTEFAGLLFMTIVVVVAIRHGKRSKIKKLNTPAAQADPLPHLDTHSQSDI